MPEIILNHKRYNSDTATKICETPHGTLYRKQRKSQEFFLYHPQGKTPREKITSVQWADANALVKTYGTRDQWMELFTTFKAETGANEQCRRMYFDPYHYVKAARNADRLGLSVKQYIDRLIDKDDANNNCSRKSGKYE